MNASARDLRERLVTGATVLLDGALGTELERRGAASTLPLWSTHALLHHADLLREIHGEYARAGAEILSANTFRTQRRTLGRAGLGHEAAELTKRAVAIARRAAKDANRSGVWIAGSAPPLEDCFRPDLAPGDDALSREHAEHARNLATAGVDLILCETQQTIREARAAARAAAAVGLPFFVSFICAPEARLLSGERLADAIEAVAASGPAALLVNCLPLHDAERCLGVLASSGFPFGVYANLGAPSEPGGTGWVADASPEEFVAGVEPWLEAGARIVGGCCGTRPDHIRALAGRIGRG